MSVQIQGQPPVGSLVENITFKTGLPREPKVTVPVTVYIPAVVTLQPNTLILVPDPNSKESSSGQVLASLRDDVDPKDVTVKSESKAFAVRIDPPGARAFRLSIDWTGKGKNPPTETVVHVRAGKETIDLPVRVNLVP